jgi:hypothetical protein
MAFTYDVATSRGKVRLKLSDTNSAAYGFEDAEIDEFLSEAGTVDGAVVLGLRVLLVDSARRTAMFNLPGMYYNDAGRVTALEKALKMYGGDLPTASVITPAALPFDSGYVEQPVIVTS